MVSSESVKTMQDVRRSKAECKLSPSRFECHCLRFEGRADARRGAIDRAFDSWRWSVGEETQKGDRSTAEHKGGGGGGGGENNNTVWHGCRSAVRDQTAREIADPTTRPSVNEAILMDPRKEHGPNRVAHLELASVGEAHGGARRAAQRPATVFAAPSPRTPSDSR